MLEWFKGAFQTGNLKMDWPDVAIIVGYLVGIVAIGCWAGFRRKKHEGDTYFLGGRNITWPIIGAALFAANISTVHMVSFAECGYKSGLLYGNFEWMAPFTLIILSIFFTPFYIRSNVTTLPDFLEKRYSRGSRDWMAFISILVAVVIHIGFAFYTGAIVLHGMFGIDTNVCIFVVAGLAGLYTIVGGLLAVMWTESIQTIILLTGAICITLISLFGFGDSIQGIGGWAGLKESVHPVNLSIIRSSHDPTGLSMWAVFLGYPVIGVWYWCCDQVIVQRVLAAKDENHARIGPLFTGFIKILPMFIFVLPGVICLGLVNKGVCPPVDDPKVTLTTLINYALPPGLKGIMAAALLAAMMGSVSAALNSIATVFSYDVVKRWWPDTSEHALVRCGRIVTAVAMVSAIVWSPLIGRFATIFQGLTDLICYMAPPITAVFLFGVFWRRASSKAALITLFAGAAMGLAVFIIDFVKIGNAWTFPYLSVTEMKSGDLWTNPLLSFLNNRVSVEWTPPGKWELNSMLSGFWMFLVSSLTMIVFSYIFPHQHTSESEALVWKHPLEALRGKTWRFLGDFRVLAALLFFTMVGLYWCFAGDNKYYPAEFTFTLADGTPVRGAKVTFRCEDAKVDNPDINFTWTDKDGKCGWGTASLAGGAPEGTLVYVQLVPDRVTVVELDDTQLARTMAERPAGSTLRTVDRSAIKDPDILKALDAKKAAAAEQCDAETGATGEHLQLGSDGAVFRLGHNGQKHLMFLPKTLIHAKYAQTATSALAYQIEAKKNVFQGTKKEILRRPDERSSP